VDYAALDLTSVANAYDDIERPGADALRGMLTLRGLPFLFAERDSQARLDRVAARRGRGAANA
jgi:hypothetical protein